MGKKVTISKVQPSNLVKEAIERRQIISEAFEKFNTTLKTFRDFQHNLELQIQDLRTELSQKNQEMQNILESLNSGLIVTDLSGKILSFNKAAFEITGFSAQGIKEQPINSLFKHRIIPLTREGKIDLNEIASNHRQQFTFEFVLQKTLFLETSTTLMRSIENQENLGIIVNLNDITHIKHLEDEAERKKKLVAMGQIAATLAHEIRNPLGGVELFISLLAKDLKDNPEHAQAIARIQAATKSMNHIISNILEYSRNRKIEKTKVDLLELVEEFSGFFQEHAKMQNIDLKIETVLKQAFIMGEKELLKQSLQNLYMNAVQAMVDGGKITLKLEKLRLDEKKDIERLVQDKTIISLEVVKLSVIDQGEGIEEREQVKILEPFFTTKPNGTGLGLSIVKQVIDAHSGLIKIDSRPHIGTSIDIYFRCANF